LKYEVRERAYIVIDTKSETTKVKVDDIDFIRQERCGLLISTKDREILVRGRIEDIEPKLHKDFVWCHCYMLVNMRNVTSTRDLALFFQNGKAIHVSKNYFGAVRRAYIRYIAEAISEW